MLSDLRFAFRMIANHRWFSAAIIVTLAFGIGINTAVFTLVNAVLFKPVPIPGGERLVVINHQEVTRPDRISQISYPDFREYQAENTTFEGLEAAGGDAVVISENDIPAERFSLGRVTTGIFEMLSTPPVLGRPFTADDGKPGAETVLLISHGVWQSRYGKAADVLGRTVRLDNAPARIIGVMPEGFRFPTRRDMWAPIVPNERGEDRSNRSLVLFGILKQGTSIEQAAGNLAVIGHRLASEFPDTNENLTPLVRTFHQAFNGGSIRAVFLLLVGAVGFVLLIACANVANMLLSRAVARSREISIRASVGATRPQIIRLMLTESVLLSVLGGLLGLGMSQFGVQAFNLATFAVRPYWIEFTMDYVAFGYFAAISVCSGIVFGLVPALRASRVDLNTALKDNTLAAGSHKGGRLIGGLVVLQFTLAVALLAGAGMMMRGLMAAQSQNDFVPAEEIFVARVHLSEGPGERYAERVARRQFFDTLLPKLTALPGVTHVAAGSRLPGTDASSRQIEIEAHPNENHEQIPTALFIIQTPDYLPAIQLPILLGRGFEETDGEPGMAGIVVTRTFAARHWPNELAVGQRLRMVDNGEASEWMTVIGVCADIVQDESEAVPASLVYVPHRIQPWGNMTLVLRTTGEPAALAEPVRQIVQAVDDQVPLFDVGSLKTVLDESRWFLPVFGAMFLVTGLIGLLMAAVGIYAVVAQGAARRTREIGIRMALGSTSAGIIRLVLSRGLWQLGLGLALGLPLAFGVTLLMSSADLLYYVSPWDPVVFMVLPALLIGVGLVACLLPARRATHVNPVEALRAE